MNSNYRYVKINNYYFCLQQSIIILAWILFFKRSDLHSILKGWLDTKHSIEGIHNYLRHYYSFFVNNSKTLILFLIYRWSIRKPGSNIKLPVYGQICKPVHQGYKVFNLQRQIVTKAFDSDARKETVIHEIDLLKEVSQIEFAPTIGKWNKEEKWYEETYIKGSLDTAHKSQDSAILLKSFSSEIIPSINTLILFRNPESRNSTEYVNELIETLESHISSNQDRDTEEVDKIRNFVYSVTDRLKSEGNPSFYLVFTHGDLCPANIINTNNKLRILDWESASYRSMMFDFYSYFFFRPVCINIPVEKMANELKAALPGFITDLELKSSNITERLLDFEQIYRWAYYIERICMLLDRERTDKNLNIMEFITRYIDAFNQYEDIVKSNMPAGHCNI